MRKPNDIANVLRGINPEGLTLDTCWEWQRGCNTSGYGQTSIGGKTTRVHRLVCEWFHGPAPDNKPCALHSCHNPKCCNPRHLRWGTHKENMEEKVSADRANFTGPRGSRSGHTSLTEEDVLSIRSRVADGEKQVDLAREFRITSGSMSSIVTRRTWKHV